MLAIGFMFIFFVSLGESFNMKKISELETRYFSMFLIFLLGGIFSIAIFSIMYPNQIMDYAKPIISNKILYVAIISEIVGVYISLKNYRINGGNIKAINFSLMFSMVIVPIYSFIGFKLGFFDGNFKIKYENNYEIILFTAAILILTIIFFADKVKNNSIVNIPLLALLPLSLSLSMYLSGNLIQGNNGFLTYGLITIGLSFAFLCFSIRLGELKKIKIREQAKLIPLMVIWLIVVPLNILSLKILAVDFITMLKRISQIITGVILDRHFKSVVPLSRKDIIIISIMVVLIFWMYLYRY